MQTEKLHAACDECRTRKLKCSGDHPACSRCGRERIKCVYSPQKPMGRPRKRRPDPEQPGQHQIEGNPTPGSYGVSSFSDMSFPSPQELDEIAGFTDTQALNTFSSALLPSSYAPTTLDSGYGHQTNQDPNFGLDHIDPSLWNTQSPADLGFDSGTPATPSQPDTGPCTCLSVAYLTISDLQSITNFSFPTIVPRLRQSMITTTNIIHCPKCPRESFSAIQNVQSIMALLSALAERFHKVLDAIDAEAAQLESTGAKKPFRVGDNSLENMHLHTGTPDCPMGFDIQIEGKDWKKLAKKALRTEVIGGGRTENTFVALLEEMERRQRRWHEDKSMHAEERAKIFGEDDNCSAREDAGMCLRMVNHVKRMVDNMNWD